MEKFGEIFEIMTSEEENKVCADCMKQDPLYASINNGVFLCEICAAAHMDYGYHISYIKHLKKSEWDEYLLCYMRRGGNRKFKTFLSEFEIIEDADHYYKYRTRAAENYRAIIRSEVLAEAPPEKISKGEGVLFSENLEVNNYPEFENYKYVGNISELKIEKEQNFSSKFKKFFKKVGNEVKCAAEKIKDKFNEMHLGEKLKNTGKKIVIVVKDAEGFIIMKSQPVIENISHQSKIGFEKISQKTKQVYLNLKSKITKRNKTEILLEETQQNSNYYELKTDHQQQTENSISKFINEEHSLGVEHELKQEAIIPKEITNINYDSTQLENKNNSFTLLNDSIVSSEKEDNSKNISYPTLDSIESYDNAREMFTNTKTQNP